MGRPERPLDDHDGPIARFAHDLRELRQLAGNPSYRELARTALFAPSVLSSAASGYRLPTLPVTLAFVAACDGDRATWERRWRAVAAHAGVSTDSRDRERDRGHDRDRDRDRDREEQSQTTIKTIREDDQPDLFFPRGTATLTRPAQLPMGSSTFIGREQALASASKVVGPDRPVKVPLLISGPIGVGKTALALRLADDFSAEFPDGQLYADFSSAGSGDQSSISVVRGFLRALGVPSALVPDDPMQRIGLYRSLLAQRRVFVLLENVRDECQVRPLLGRTMRSQVVVTSRARLLGLDGTHRIDLDAFTRQESMALIGRLIGTARVEAEYEATDALAELCGDLPLAVSIIGRKIAARPGWAVAYTAGLLADRSRLMDGLSVGDVSVRDRFAVAYQQLSPAGRQAIHQLGLGGGSWTTAIGLAAAMGVPIDTADELLESLVDAGMLTRANVASRYHVSTLVSVFAAGAQHEAKHVAVSLLNRRPQRTLLESPRRDAGRAHGFVG